MPTYEYECKDCGHSFEAFQSMSDEPLTTCPRCGKEIRRIITGGGGVIFKGSGFYMTDTQNKTADTIKETAKKEAPPNGVVADSSGKQKSKPAVDVPTKKESL
ncbi:MAG: zinc ribbon domain-containing protein [Treponema sp.]|jgi:putative FmdB family regulatory protein|nr:zinc ribbon domain-containing protein [Treponema sp.]